MNVDKAKVFKFTTILFACLFIVATISYAATPSTTLTISSGLYPGAPSYTIYKVGSTYYAKDQNGYLEIQSTNASYVINNARGNLTAGRTWTEKIVCIGNFVLTNPIITNIHTIWDFKAATFQLASGANCVMFTDDGSMTGGSNRPIVQIDGGLFLGNQSLQTGDWRGIDFDGANNARLIIHDTVIYDTGSYAIAMTGCPEPYLSNLKLAGNAHGGIWMSGVYDGDFERIVVTPATSDGNEACIEMSDHYCNNNYFKDCYFGGAVYNVIINGAYMNTFTSCNNVDGFYGGYDFRVESGTYYAHDNQIIGGHSHHNSWTGGNGTSIIFAAGCNNNTVTSMLFDDIMGNDNADNIAITDAGTDNFVSGNTFRNELIVSIKLSGANCTVTNNKFYSPLGIEITSTATLAFISENMFRGSTDDVADAGTGTVFGNNYWKDGSYDITAP